MALPYTFLITIVVLLLSVPYVWANPLPRQSLPRTNPHGSFQDQLGAVASESNICSQIGIDLLKKGGNAADAVGYSKPSFFRSLLT
jgi:gamma-glutamyltranspeptidase / glutathione hydrolase